MKKIIILICALIVSCDNSSSTDNNNATPDPKDDIIYGPVMSGVIGFHKWSDPNGRHYDTVATCQMSYNITGGKLMGSIKITGEHFKWVDKLSYNSGYFEGHAYIYKDSLVERVYQKDTTWRYFEYLVGLASFDASTNKSDSIALSLNDNSTYGWFAKPDSLELTVRR